MKKNIVVLCPLNENLRHAPGHLVFASNYFEEKAKELGLKVRVKHLFFKQHDYGIKTTIWLNIRLAMRILSTGHDVLYYTTDPNNLFLLALLKRLGVYRKKMYAWKYTIISRGGNLFASWMKQLAYNAFNTLFMITERHVGDSVREGIVGENRLKYMRWGEDLKYTDRFASEKSPVFTFVTTGKAYRDFETLCNAFAHVHDARLCIFTTKSWGG